MAKKPRKRSRDSNALAASIVGTAIGDLPVEEPSKKNPAAVELGKLGGAKGGKVRASKLSPERRREIAQHAAQARWAKQ